MTLPVFWTDRLDAGVGQRVTLEGDEGRHAVAVRRLRVGEELVIGDGNGRSVVAQIEEVAKNSLVAVVSEVRERQAPEPRITVVQAIRADVIFKVVSNPKVQPVAEEVDAKLRRVLERL